jgi:hypothetical protein
MARFQRIAGLNAFMMKDPCSSAKVRLRSTQLQTVAKAKLDNRVPIPLFINE